MTFVGREVVASGKLELSLLDQRGFPPTGHWIVRGHSWWSPRGSMCRGLSWHFKHSAWQEFLYFLCHARTSCYIIWALCNRVQGRDQHWWPLRNSLWNVTLSGAGKSGIAIEWTRGWIPCPKLVVWGEEPIAVPNPIQTLWVYHFTTHSKELADLQLAKVPTGAPAGCTIYHETNVPSIREGDVLQVLAYPCKGIGQVLFCIDE